MNSSLQHPPKWVRVLLLLCLTCVLLGQADYLFLKYRQSPAFSRDLGQFFDGGTRYWYGFGYTVIQNHGTSYSVQHGRTWMDAEFATGPELRYWVFPFTLFNRDDVKITTKHQSP